METIEINNLIKYIQSIKKITKNEAEISDEIGKKYALLENKNQDYINEYYKQYIKSISNENELQIAKHIKTLLFSGETKKFAFYFRGHYSSKYELLPSVFRDDNWEKENYYYHEITVRCPDKFAGASHLDKLVTMQHYACPTRLIDISSNPLVALYFACKNYGCRTCNSSREGCVLIFAVSPSEIVYSDSARALMLSCLARFSTSDKSSLVSISKKYLASERFKQLPGGSRYLDDIVEKYFHEITSELPSFKRELKPIDLLKPLFVQPNRTNARILKQDGAFIINGLSEHSTEAREKLDKIVYARLIIKNQEEILDELNSIGINEASLFPEIDKVASFLKDN